jgi:hypothetical protein
MLTVVHKMQRMALALTVISLEQFQKDGDEFLSHIVQVIDGETWVSFVDVETKEQSKKWMHTFTRQPEKVQTNVICQKADGNCFLRQERSTDGGIHATGDHSNVRSVLQNAEKLCRAIQNQRFIHIQLPTLEHCWNISTGSCLTTLLTTLILL